MNALIIVARFALVVLMLYVAYRILRAQWQKKKTEEKPGEKKSGEDEQK